MTIKVLDFKKQSLSILREILSETQIEKLNGIRYNDCPASSRYHLNIKHGLVIHSLYVTLYMLKLNKDLDLKFDRKDIILVGMFHDLNKCYQYKPNVLKSGDTSNANPFKRIPIIEGDGELSCFIVSQLLKVELTPITYHAIRYHNIFEDSFKHIASRTLNSPEHHLSLKLIWLIQTCDMYCSNIIKM